MIYSIFKTAGVSQVWHATYGLVGALGVVLGVVLGRAITAAPSAQPPPAVVGTQSGPREAADSYWCASQEHRLIPWPLLTSGWRAMSKSLARSAMMRITLQRCGPLIAGRIVSLPVGIGDS
jgi:hypothetical protein